MDLREEFRRLSRAYKGNDFESIFTHEYGICFLKMRSIARAAIMRELANDLKIDVSEIPGKNLFEFFFCRNINKEILDDFIRKTYEEERRKRIQNEDYLYSQLYKLRVFDWGGFYQNAVEQTIVNNYIKKIQNYDDLCNSIENDINPRLRGYVLCSWYNHWTSILIEDMFKDHPDVLPAVGLIKKVDFFWKDFPFDLKVTYFPDEFMQLKRSELNCKPELADLKLFARANNVYYDKNARNREIFSELLAKISEDTSKKSKEFIECFQGVRKYIIRQTIDNPRELIRWYYEQQGVRRFDAANRFFLVLIDFNNLEDSWKLKRNKKSLRGAINEFLDNSKELDFEKLKISFHWEGEVYTTYATTLFLVKE